VLSPVRHSGTESDRGNPSRGSQRTSFEGFIAKSNDELKNLGAVQTETKSAINNLSAESIKLADRVAAMEQKLTAGGEESKAELSIGDQFVGCRPVRGARRGSPVPRSPEREDGDHQHPAGQHLAAAGAG